MKPLLLSFQTTGRYQFLKKGSFWLPRFFCLSFYSELSPPSALVNPLPFLWLLFPKFPYKKHPWLGRLRSQDPSKTICYFSIFESWKLKHFFFWEHLKLRHPDPTHLTNIILRPKSICATHFLKLQGFFLLYVVETLPDTKRRGIWYPVLKNKKHLEEN